MSGTQLGPDCCEVVVNHVLKRAAPFLRPYGNMNYISDAVGRSIAWPRQHIKEQQKSLAQPEGSRVRGKYMNSVNYVACLMHIWIDVMLDMSGLHRII